MGKRKKWYCYVCGEKVRKNYCLISMADSTDRVFLVHRKCARQIDNIDYMTLIEELPTKKGSE